MTKTEEPTLADEFIADSHQVTKRMNLSGRVAKDFDETMERYRSEMRRAHRFVLDDTFTELATTISSTSRPEKTLARLQYATLPYEITWIEFDCLVKMRTIRALRGLTGMPDGVVPRLGLLMYRINDTDALVQPVSNYTSRVQDIGALPHMTGYLFSTVERDFVHETKPTYGTRPFAMLTSDNARLHDVKSVKTDRDGNILTSAGDAVAKTIIDLPINVSKSALWGYSNGQKDALIDMDNMGFLHTPSFLMRHGDSCYSRVHETLFNSLEKNHPHAARILFGHDADVLMNTLVSSEMLEFVGTIRWVVTVLAMLNEVPVLAGHVQPSGHQRVGLTGARRLMDYHRVQLSLPKTKPLAYVERQLRNSEIRHRRAHEVRQHWRHYLHRDGRVNCRREEHDWVMDHENGYGLCATCEAYMTRIPEHVRGDASLGWVRKDYVIKSSQT